MKQPVYTERTQISLSPELKALIEKRGGVLNESLSEYLRKSAILRLFLDELEKEDLSRIANAVVGGVSKEKSGWKDIKNISLWQRKERAHEDKHRP